MKTKEYFDNFEEDLYKKLREYGVPVNLWEPIVRYILNGTQPGNFLSSVIKNQLLEAFTSADPVSTQHMKNIVTFFYNSVPAGCFGNEEKLIAWREEGGLYGIMSDGSDSAS